MTMHRRLPPLLVAAALSVAFAPAPPPKTGIAEAVLNAFGGGPDQVRHTLEAMLPATLQSAKLGGLACLKGEGSPAEWVRMRLRVEEVAPKGPVRVRLGGCRPNEALALLTALVQAYEDSRRTSRLESLEELLVVQGLAARGGRINLNELNLSIGRQDGPAVLQRPGLLSTGTSR
jgi:hypothetical protein